MIEAPDKSKKKIVLQSEVNLTTMQSSTLLFGQRSLNTVSSSVNLSSFEVGMLLAFIPHPISLFPELFSISLNGSRVLGSHL